MRDRARALIPVAGLPILPLILLYSPSPPRIILNASAGVMVMTYVAAWLIPAGLGAWLVTRRETSRHSSGSDHVLLGVLILLAVPYLLVAMWVVSSPIVGTRLFLLLCATSILPLLFYLGWELRFKELCRGASWVELLVLPTGAAVLTLVAAEVAANAFLRPHLFHDDLAVSSPDRRYWYYVRRMVDGRNSANSYGFIGPQPSLRVSGTRMLLIGDSIPAGGMPVNFPKVAEEEYNRRFGREGRIEVVNASIGGFSIDQIYRYYDDKLRDLPHHFLLFSFYVDDVNREIRIRKNNYLYSLAWPEWQQDVYFKCYLCGLALNLFGMSDTTFLTYRTRSYEDAFPGALATLERTREVAASRGAVLAVLNIPRFTWNGVLTDASQYEYRGLNERLEAWCRVRGVPYFDALPLLIGKDIGGLRVSETDIHFAEMGHRVLGLGLVDFLASLTGAGDGRDDPSPESTRRRERSGS